MITKEQIIEKLKTVKDPEVDLDIYSMGLVYDMVINDDGSVHVLHTLTSPACPMGPTIQDDIRSAILSLGASSVDVELTFDPPYQPSDELRMALGI
jgi:metal-sulfur cluster biosynthetic enzyme